MNTNNNTNNKISAKQFFSGSFSLLKNSLWLIVIQVIMSLFSMVMSTDAENPSEIIRALSIVMTASTLLIIFFISKSSAYTDFQIYKNNYIRRKRGEVLPAENIIKQYRWFNGLIYSFVACLPSIILAIIGIAKSPISSESNWGGSVAMLINLVYIIPFINYGALNSLYLVFLANFFVIASASLGYFLQGEKLKLQFFDLQNKKSKK